MSLAAPSPAASQRPQTYQKSSSTSIVPTPDSTYTDDLDRFYDLDDEEDGSTLMMDEVIQTKTAMAAAVVVPVAVDSNSANGPPSLPQKHNLRASRLLDAMTLGKLGAMLEPADITTPHDVYLSSEEDASSSADDFSDYEFESASEEMAEEQQSPATPESPAASTPPRRRSHEVTARVVSVVFSGKPSVIELPRRIGTPGSSRHSDSDLAAARQRQSDIVSADKAREMILASIPAPTPEPILPAATPRSSPHSSVASRSPRRRSSVFSTILHGGKPKPPFLNIDPFANGSTYSLEIPKEEETQTRSSKHDYHNIPLYPKSPTAILKGMKNTLGTIRRRSSRQALNSQVFDSPPPPSRSSTTPVTAPSVTSSPVQTQQRPSMRPVSFYSSSSSTAESTLSEMSGPPQSPVTYNDIIKAAKRNARAEPKAMMPLSMPPLEASEEMMPPPSPTTKKGLMKLRRRSQKIVNGRLV